MTNSEILNSLQGRFGSQIQSVQTTSLDPYAVVETSSLVEVCRVLRDEFHFTILNDLSGVDYLEPEAKKLAKAGFEPHLEVVYHVSRFDMPGQRLKLKVLLPRFTSQQTGEMPETPSVASIWRAADWHEREVFDLFGVKFTGHPDLRRILLSDDWVGHPLRKDYEFPLEYHDIRCR